MIPKAPEQGSDHEPKQIQVLRSLGPWDFAGTLAGFFLTILTTCVLSHGRIFWEDELLGWTLLQDPSWHHMLTAWKLGADGDGLAFLLTGRAWFRIFGASELSFRLYSSTCFGLAFAVAWVAARRFYRTAVVAFALFYMFFFSPIIVMHMTEGRFYGLEVLSAALAVWLAFIVAAIPERVPPYLYLAIFLIHSLLTTSHLLGVLYSVSLVLAMMMLDRWDGRFRPMLYLSAAASWLFLIPERTAIIASAQVGKPHFWTTQPTVGEFVLAYSGGSANIAFALFLLCLAAAISLWRRPQGWQNLRCAFHERRPAYIVALALLLVPLALFVEGFVGTPLMIYRYLQPVTIALALVTCEALQLISPPKFFRNLLNAPTSAQWMRLTLAVFFGVCVLFRVFFHFRDISYSPKNYTDALSEKLPKGTPVVCEDAYTFTEMLGSQHASGIEYIFLLDWNQSVAPTAPHGEVTEFHLMENLRKAGYFSESIQYLNHFLAKNDRFFVIHLASRTHPNLPPTIGNPIAERLSLDPKYQVSEYTEMDRDSIRYDAVRYTVWQICRGRCSAQNGLSSQ
jgi:hypothetical protein